MNKNISISLPEELWQEIDKLRGAVSRSAWVRGALEVAVELEKAAKGQRDWRPGALAAVFNNEDYGAVVGKPYDQQCQREEVMPGERIPTGRTSPSIAEGGAAQSRSSAPLKRSTRRVSGDLAFDVWWDAYPKKIGKRAAFAAWRRIPKQDRPAGVEVAKFIEEAKRTKRWREGFIPNPLTFVNQRRWEDDPLSYGPAVAPPRPPEEPLPVLTDTEGLEIWEALLHELRGMERTVDVHEMLDMLVPVAIEVDRPEQYYPVDVVVRAPNEHIRYMIEQEMAADGRRSIITAACQAANIGLRWEQPKRS